MPCPYMPRSRVMAWLRSALAMSRRADLPGENSSSLRLSARRRADEGTGGSYMVGIWPRDAPAPRGLPYPAEPSIAGEAPYAKPAPPLPLKLSY